MAVECCSPHTIVPFRNALWSFPISPHAVTSLQLKQRNYKSLFSLWVADPEPKIRINSTGHFPLQNWSVRLMLSTAPPVCRFIGVHLFLYGHSWQIAVTLISLLNILFFVSSLRPLFYIYVWFSFPFLRLSFLLFFLYSCLCLPLFLSLLCLSIFSLHLSLCTSLSSFHCFPVFPFFIYYIYLFSLLFIFCCAFLSLCFPLPFCLFVSSVLCRFLRLLSLSISTCSFLFTSLYFPSSLSFSLSYFPYSLPLLSLFISLLSSNNKTTIT